MSDGPVTTTSSWPYLDIAVREGARELKPTHVCATEMIFTDAPRFTSDQVTLITRSGQRETTRLARVLPHEQDATQIPIRLLAVSDEKAPSKLTA